MTEGATSLLAEVQAKLREVNGKVDFIGVLNAFEHVVPTYAQASLDNPAGHAAWNALVDWMVETGLCVQKTCDTYLWDLHMTYFTPSSSSSPYFWARIDDFFWELCTFGSSERRSFPLWMLSGFVRLGFAVNGRSMVLDNKLPEPVFEEVVTAMTAADKSVLAVVARKELAVVHPMFRTRFTRRLRYIDPLL